MKNWLLVFVLAAFIVLIFLPSRSKAAEEVELSPVIVMSREEFEALKAEYVRQSVQLEAVVKAARICYSMLPRA